MARLTIYINNQISVEEKKSSLCKRFIDKKRYQSVES